MYAISIQQPFVEQILKGVKRREYRSRPTRITGRVYLYASLKVRQDLAEWRKAGLGISEAPTGLIVGTVEIVGCVRDRQGGYAYLLSNPRRLRRPRRARNQPQPCFWRPEF